MESKETHKAPLHEVPAGRLQKWCSI